MKPKLLAMRALFLVMLVSSCRDSQPAPAPKEGTPVVVQPSAAVDPSQRAHQLVERWLAAQNKGDFAAYQALYATSFEGVRQSGSRRVALDRAGWLADRGRMFKKPMTVSVADVIVAPVADGLEVTFKQTFRSLTWADEGQKKLVLVDQAGALSILREEMLDSHRLPTESGIKSGAATPAATDLKGLDHMEALRGALHAKGVAALKELLPPTGALTIEVHPCASEDCEPTQTTSVTRKSISRESFVNIYLDDDKIDCAGFAVSGICNTFAGGYQGEYTFSRQGDQTYLTKIVIQTD